MTCCSIPTGCGIPVTGCTGSSVAAGHVLVEMDAGQIPLYVDACAEDIYYYDGTKWIILGGDEKSLTYDEATHSITLRPDGSSVIIPMASTSVAGLVKLPVDGAITTDASGNLVIDCAKLKAECSLLDKSMVPTGGVIYYNTTTNKLDIDCDKLITKCGLAKADDTPISGTHGVTINPTTKKLEVDCPTLIEHCDLAKLSDIPTEVGSGTQGVKINATTKELEVDCAALISHCGLATDAELPKSGTHGITVNATTKKLEVDCATLVSHCNLATMDDIPEIPPSSGGSIQQVTFGVGDLANTDGSAGLVITNVSPMPYTATIDFYATKLDVSTRRQVVQVLSGTALFQGSVLQNGVAIAFTDLGGNYYRTEVTIPANSQRVMVPNIGPSRFPPAFSPANYAMAWVTVGSGITVSGPVPQN